MASPIADESNGPAGMPVYGFDPSHSPKDAYNSFIDSLNNMMLMKVMKPFRSF